VPEPSPPNATSMRFVRPCATTCACWPGTTRKIFAAFVRLLVRRDAGHGLERDRRLEQAGSEGVDAAHILPCRRQLRPEVGVRAEADGEEAVQVGRGWPVQDLTASLIGCRSRLCMLQPTQEACTTVICSSSQPGQVATDRAAPTIPALLCSVAGTIGVRSLMSGRNLSDFRLTPPPTMIRSGQSSRSTSSR
jgi:hypothetical protein